MLALNSSTNGVVRCLADVRASPRYQDRLTLTETRPKITMKAPRMLSDTFKLLTSRVGILNDNGPGIRLGKEMEAGGDMFRGV